MHAAAQKFYFNSAEMHIGISLRGKVQTEKVSVLPWASYPWPLMEGKPRKLISTRVSVLTLYSLPSHSQHILDHPHDLRREGSHGTLL